MLEFLSNNNIPEFTVGQISRAIKMVVEDAFGYVKIRGEVSGFKQASSGHCYFSLKDSEGLISAVCFRNIVNNINFKIEDGLEIVVFGKVTTYEGRSNYQIIVQKVEIAGIGALLDMIEKRRQKLLEEGLFEQKYKKPLPFWPSIIGVITSKTGAVIEDIIHRVENRFPTSIHLYPAAVQGQNSAAEIIAAIKYFNALTDNIPDVLIIARGGGSLEDLMSFNDEELVRAVFASKIPIISAVGHETDTTLIDYVSDIRAPTPSAAAEIATPVLADLKNLVKSLELRLQNYFKNSLINKEKDLSNLARSLIRPRQILDQNAKKINDFGRQLQFLIGSYLLAQESKVKFLAKSMARPDQILKSYENRVLFLEKNLTSNFNNKIANLESKMALTSQLLDSYHYQKVLKRGYAIIRNDHGVVITNIGQIFDNQKINIELDGGNIDAITNQQKGK